MPKVQLASLLVTLLLLATSATDAADDVIIADFEAETYGDWKVAGEAFGSGPARGTLPQQHPVSGFQGKGMVNTYLKGDSSQGTLTSPPVQIARKYVNLLVGGGNKPGEACVNLVIDGKTVRTATGQDDEALDWVTWDVSDLQGKTARIEIVDKVGGGWGHVNVDHIVLSDARKVEPVKPEPLYRERLRPQFHFSPRTNWTNDPNGLVFYQGEYHLFFQHNPKGINWGNMTWGHAVSPDLLHWEQLANAIEPDELGTIFSGSAVVDGENTAGFQAGDKKVIVCIYTSAGKPFTQSIAYSRDRGRTWTKYEKNPVLGHIVGGNRDPKVIWHAPTKRWVMALYLDKDQYALFSSPDLKQWTKTSDVPPLGATECPDLFELSVEGTPGQSRWIFWGGNNNYLIGQFDGKSFLKESGPYRFEHGDQYYAAQTYSDIPQADGRRIQIAWMRGGKYPGMPFNQQMSFPSTLTLRSLPEGLRLCSEPVKELDAIHGRRHAWSGTLKEGENPLAGIAGDLFDIRAEFEPGTAEEITFTLRGTAVRYDVKKKQLVLLGKTAALEPVDGRVRLQILLDRSSIEVFGNGGRANISVCFVPPKDDMGLAVAARGGPTVVKSLDVWELKSAWGKP